MYRENMNLKFSETSDNLMKHVAISLIYYDLREVPLYRDLKNKYVQVYALSMVNDSCVVVVIMSTQYPNVHLIKNFLKKKIRRKKNCPDYRYFHVSKPHRSWLSSSLSSIYIIIVITAFNHKK